LQYKDIIYTKEGHIATIILNRPERLNAFSMEMIDSIERALQDAAGDEGVRVVVITGAGRGFCSGADMKAAVDIGAAPSVGILIRMPQLPSIALSIDKPTIASINGPAIGWGLELALLCDIRIAAETARLGDLHVSRSAIADNGGLFLLPRLIGWARACELYFSGQIIGGREAECIGLVNRAVPPEELASVTSEMATNIAKQSPLAVQLAKRAMRDGLSSDLKALQDHALLILRFLFQTEDFKESMSSFIERREPQFKGK
jgi:enoyl-CoA hydratase/carnithine racemase